MGFFHSLLARLLCVAVGCSCLSANAHEPIAPAAVLQPSPGGWRTWLRTRVAYQTDWQKYGLRLDDDWRQADPQAPVVVLLHGFNSTPERSDSLIRLARQEGLPCGVFAYPNDQPLADSAVLLSGQLKSFVDSHPGRRVALVTHSMGGLVARACIEDAALDPKVVDRLIMVSPPTHGSMLARYAVGLDLWEHWLNRTSGDPWRRVRDSLVDGLSEAPGDLQPGSAFLTRLNARARCESAQYTLILGDRAQLSDSQRYLLKRSLLAAADHTPGWEASVERVDEIVSKLDEVIEGRGDGAVAISRGRLEGVTDTHVLRFSHLSVVRDADDATSQQVQRIIVDRVRAADGA